MMCAQVDEIKLNQLMPEGIGLGSKSDELPQLFDNDVVKSLPLSIVRIEGIV